MMLVYQFSQFFNPNFNDKEIHNKIQVFGIIFGFYYVSVAVILLSIMMMFS